MHPSSELHADTRNEPQSPDLLGLPAARPAGIWGFWLWLTVPGPVPGLAPVRQRERQRLARLQSALQLAILILVVLFLPRGLLPVLDLGTLVATLGFGLCVIVSIYINRIGAVTTASWIFIGSLALAIAGAQLFPPNGYISFQDLAAYDFLVIPIFLTGLLLSRSAIVFMWLGCTLFMLLDLGFSPHNPTLTAYLPKTPIPFLSIYPVAIFPFVLMTIVAVITSLGAGSVGRALEEADRTEDIERAYSLLAEQNRELEEAIASIQQVYSRVANGDLNARAPATSGHLLLPLAVSLNLMLERLSRTSSAQTTLTGLEQQILQLTQHAALLGQGKLGNAVPQHNMGQLRPIAQHLEQLRTGIVQVTRSTSALANQLQAVHQTAETHVHMLEQQPSLAAEIVPQVRQSMNAEQKLIRTLQDYMREFVPS